MRKLFFSISLSFIFSLGFSQNERIHIELIGSLSINEVQLNSENFKPRMPNYKRIGSYNITSLKRLEESPIKSVYRKFKRMGSADLDSISEDVQIQIRPSILGHKRMGGVTRKIKASSTKQTKLPKDL